MRRDRRFAAVRMTISWGERCRAIGRRAWSEGLQPRPVISEKLPIKVHQRATALPLALPICVPLGLAFSLLRRS